MGASGARRARILVACSYGQELRAFVHSGLVEQLATWADVHVGMPAPDELGVGATLSSLRVFAGPAAEARPDLARRAADAVSGEVVRRGPGPRWRQNSQSAASSWRRRALGSVAAERTARMASAVDRGLSRVRRGSEEWGRCLDALDPDLVLVTSASSARALPLLYAAARRRLPAVVAQNSWKDAYIRERIPVPIAHLHGLTRLGARHIARHNAHLQSEQWTIAPALHLSGLLGSPPVEPRDAFCGRLGLDPIRPYALLTLATSRAAPGEHTIVDRLVDELERGALGEELRLLVRLNPMENEQRLVERWTRPRVVVQQPEWRWDPVGDWCAPTVDDGPSWHAALEHATVNVSLPSTVTLEALVTGLPVLNIAFGGGDGNLRRFWDAPYYGEVRDLPGITRCASFDELVAGLASAGGRPERRALVDPVVERLWQGERDPIGTLEAVLRRTVGR